MKSLSFTVCFATCSFFVGGVFAQPTPIALNNMAPIQFCDSSGKEYTVYYDLGDVLWCPVQNGSNGKYTQHCVQPIENLEINKNFSITVTLPSGNQMSVSAGMINRYWDFYMRVKGAERIGEPSWAMNCHGYSTELNYWIHGGPANFSPCCSPSGIETLLSDDWQQITSMQELVNARCIYWFPDHTIRIDGIFDLGTLFHGFSWVVVQTTEKCGYAGIYKTVDTTNYGALGILIPYIYRSRF